MKIETDGYDLIFTPEKDEEYNQLYRSAVDNKNYHLLIKGKEIKEMRISKEYLLTFLLIIINP